MKAELILFCLLLGGSSIKCRTRASPFVRPTKQLPQQRKDPVLIENNAYLLSCTAGAWFLDGQSAFDAECSRPSVSQLW